MGIVYVSDKNIAVLEDTQKEWKKKLNLYGMLYICAMSGFGKTASAITFAGRQFSAWNIISAEDENFLIKAEDYLIENKNTRVKTLLILDDLQWLLEEGQKDKLTELLSSAIKGNRKIQILILSRAPLPPYLMKFQFYKQLFIENRNVLFMEESQIQELLNKIKLPERYKNINMLQLAKECLKVTKGYPIAVDIFIGLFIEGQMDLAAIEALTLKKVFLYFDDNVFSKWTNTVKDVITKLAVFPKFNTYMAKYVLGHAGKKALNDLIQISSFLSFTAPDNYTIHPLFLNYLRLKQNEMPKDERNKLYHKAGSFYEETRNYEEALRCYLEAGENEKIIKLLIYMNENADGCAFARISEKYLDILPDAINLQRPKLLGAKAMQLSYQMKISESNEYLEQLKKMAEEEKKTDKAGEAIEAYIRTIIALPHGKADELQGNLSYFVKYLHKHEIRLKNIMPTGNMPSVINGGLDLSEWVNKDESLYPFMKKAIEIDLEKEAIGITDIFMGEIQYEKNNKTEAMDYLVKGLSDINRKGSVRAWYAANGIMARLFQSENQPDTAADILIKVKRKAEKAGFLELLPNIHASLALCSLLKGDKASIEDWYNNYAPDEHVKFYITDRFQLLTKANIYVSMKREMEALYILSILEKYAKLYDRIYLQIQISLLRSIILYRRGEEWQPLLLDTVGKAYKYSYIRVLADQGAALLPLWREVNWKNTNYERSYIATILKELKKMAACYPYYFKIEKGAEHLSPKELDVLKLVAKGCNNKEISKLMDISTGTVKFHISNLLKKLKAENRTMAVNIAKEEELL